MEPVSIVMRGWGLRLHYNAFNIAPYCAASFIEKLPKYISVVLVVEWPIDLEMNVSGAPWFIKVVANECRAVWVVNLGMPNF